MNPKNIRSLEHSAAALRSWALTPDPAARTAPGREAFLNRFAEEVDPDHRLTADREHRAQQLRTAYFRQLAAKSARARSNAKAQTEVAEAAEAELASLTGGAAG